MVEKGERLAASQLLAAFLSSILLLVLLVSILLPSRKYLQDKTMYCEGWELGTVFAIKEIEMRELELGGGITIDKCPAPTDAYTPEALCDGFTRGYEAFITKVTAPSYPDFQIELVEICFNHSRSIWF